MLWQMTAKCNNQSIAGEHHVEGKLYFRNREILFESVRHLKSVTEL